MAAAALGSLAAPHALPELSRALTAPDKYTRILAAQALGALGPAATQAVPDLDALAGDPDVDVRIAGVEALGRIGPGAARAVSRLAGYLQAPDRRLKEAAEAALQSIGGAEAVAALAQDARRYAEADRAEYRRLRQNPDRAALSRFAGNLPRARRAQLAGELVQDVDLPIVELGIAVLIDEGREEEAVPVLARTLLESPGRLPRAGTERHGHQQFGRMLGRVCAYYETNASRYSPAEQERVRTQICREPRR
jgi:hypothetical protein